VSTNCKYFKNFQETYRSLKNMETVKFLEMVYRNSSRFGLRLGGVKPFSKYLTVSILFSQPVCIT
jgi:hypothetical protein